jgi:tetraacyldisaccharide-1-P 4'-kinase
MGADVLLTTAKDAVNLDPDYPAIVGQVKVYWLEIRTEIEQSEEFFDLIRRSAPIRPR